MYNAGRLTKNPQRISLGEVIMTTYTFYVNGDYKTVESDTEEEGIEEAGIKEGDV